VNTSPEQDALAGPTVIQGAPEHDPADVSTVIQAASEPEPAPELEPTIVPTVIQSSPDAEPARPVWNLPADDDIDDTATRPAWNLPPAEPLAVSTDAAAESVDSADTVAYTPPTDQPPAYTPPAPPVYVPPMPSEYTPPAPPPLAPPLPAYMPPAPPPQQPEYISPAADMLPETVAYTPPTDQPPQQPPAYTPPVAPPQQPPAYTPPAPPAYAPPQQPPAYTPAQQQPAYTASAPQAGYQAGYPTAPAQPWTGQQAQAAPKKKSRTGCVIGCLLALVLVVGGAAGGLFYLNNQPGGVTVGNLTIGGANTGPGGGKIIYQNAMDGSNKSDWTNDSNCFFGSGGYHINAGYICYSPADRVGNADTTVSVKQISGPIIYSYGMVIRRVSKGNYYAFQINANGKWLFSKVVNGTNTDIVALTSNAAIKTGLNQVNTLSVRAQGSHFVFSVNGTQVGTADDSTFTSGDTGLVGYNGIEVIFTNLSVANIKQ
jgi:hypothetical protein